MSRCWIVGVVVAVVVAAISASIAFLMTTREKITIAEFEEFDELTIYIDANGDASCTLVAQLPPSELSNFMKQLTLQMGENVVTQSYEESIRESQSRVGFEVENVSCEVTGFSENENFKLVLTWKMPKMARWADNKWTITFSLVDNQNAAKEIIAGEESNWTLIRSIAMLSDIDIALYRISYRNVTVLPEGAEDIHSDAFDSYDVFEYGGGSRAEGSVSLGQVNGMPAVIENGMILIATENEIAITPEQYLEKSIPYTITYGGVSPENPSFADSLEPLRLDLKYGRELTRYFVYNEGSWYSLTPPQLLYMTAEAITTIYQENDLNISPPLENIAGPSTENGDWGFCWKNLSKTEYVSLAQAVLDDINEDVRVPGEIESPVGKMRFRDVLYTFTRVISHYRRTRELPAQIATVPVPSGKLRWGSGEIPASHAYYLLPDTYVITHTNRANSLLDNLRDNLDNKGLAEEICNWTGSNITYGLSFVPPTSEEVLVSKRGQCREFTNVYLAISRTAGIPARRVTGWIRSEWQPPAGWEFVVATLPDGRKVASHAWVQVYIPEEGWIPVEPQSKKPDLYVGTLPYEVYKQSEQTWMSALANYEAASGLI